MSDVEQALYGIRQAEVEHREIDNRTARIIGNLFHDGSALTLAFASTGTIKDVTALDRALFPDYLRMPPSDRIMRNWLGTYLVHAGKRGAVDGWSDMR